MKAPNGATRKNAQPLPLLVLEVGLPLPTTAELPLPTTAGLPAGLPCGATAGDPPVLVAGAGAGAGDVVTAAGRGGWYVTGAALVGGGAGTDETCETCETWELCPPIPDT
jgi:hypothetical protein